MNQKDLSPIALALGITGALACSSAVAADNPFSLTELSPSHMVAGEHGEGNCGEGKCGEGKCGEDAEDGAAEGEAAEEGKCGEGRCGEGKCGEGKCGEGKCGGDAEESSEGEASE